MPDQVRARATLGEQSVTEATGKKRIHPPSGTLTFLFTDIEGSTAMWENNPLQMESALARHDEILREVIEANGGYVFKTVGDAYCAAFASAREAALATLAAQRTLYKVPWEDPAA